MGWVIVIALLVIWTSYGPVWAVLTLIGVALLLHIRNLYMRRYGRYGRW